MFLANYAYININDPMTRVPGIGQVQDLRRRPVRDAVLGQPGQLAKLGITVTEILRRDQEAEHREPGRPGRRRAGAAGPGVHLHGARAGPPAHRRRSSATSSCARIPTARSCG